MAASEQVGYNCLAINDRLNWSIRIVLPILFRLVRSYVLLLSFLSQHYPLRKKLSELTITSPTTLAKIMNMFRRPRVAPAKVDSDEVVPISFFDDTFLFKTFVLHSIFVFDDVLDVQKLGDALETLARRDGWRKLAARLRKNVGTIYPHRLCHLAERPITTDSKPGIRQHRVPHPNTLPPRATSHNKIPHPPRHYTRPGPGRPAHHP